MPSPSDRPPHEIYDPALHRHWRYPEPPPRDPLAMLIGIGLAVLFIAGAVLLRAALAAL